MQKEGKMNNESWVDSIVEAMQILGGDAHYSDLYPLVKDIRRSRGLSIPPTFEETVRRCIQDHSSDSQGFKGIDVFTKIDKGHWGLRNTYKYAKTFGESPIENQKDIKEIAPIELGAEEDNLAMAEDGKQLSDMEEVKLKKYHYKYEGRLSQNQIKRIKIENGYVCEACGMSFAKNYPGLGDGFIECHHKIPYADMKEGEKRKVEPADFMVLCSNCHRMIHRLEDPADLDKLKEIIRNAD